MSDRNSAGVVIFSERLGPLGPLEQRIAQQTGAHISAEPLFTEDQLIDAGSRADVLVVGAVEPVTAAVANALARTRLIVRRGVGVNNIDVAAASARGLPIAYVPDASVEEVSDHAVALLLALERRVALADDLVRAGKHLDAGAAVGPARRFADMTVGIVGFGRIGRATGRKLIPLVARVVATDPYVTDDVTASVGVELVELDELFARCDAIMLHTPLVDGTRGLVDAPRLALMPEGSLLVNTARGELVDEEALVGAVRSGRLAGAGLDVTCHEPLSADDPLLGEPRILLTGHTASKGRRSNRTLREAVVQAVLDGLAGRVPRHLADAAVLSHDRCTLQP